jgi:hypothetical protein
MGHESVSEFLYRAAFKAQGSRNIIRLELYDEYKRNSGARRFFLDRVDLTDRASQEET